MASGCAMSRQIQCAGPAAAQSFPEELVVELPCGRRMIFRRVTLGAAHLLDHREIFLGTVFDERGSAEQLARDTALSGPRSDFLAGAFTRKTSGGQLERSYYVGKYEISAPNFALLQHGLLTDDGRMSRLDEPACAPIRSSGRRDQGHAGAAGSGCVLARRHPLCRSCEWLADRQRSGANLAWSAARAAVGGRRTRLPALAYGSRMGVCRSRRRSPERGAVPEGLPGSRTMMAELGTRKSPRSRRSRPCRTRRPKARRSCTRDAAFPTFSGSTTCTRQRGGDRLRSLPGAPAGRTGRPGRRRHGARQQCPAAGGNPRRRRTPGATVLLAARRGACAGRGLPAWF